MRRQGCDLEIIEPNKNMKIIEKILNKCGYVKRRSKPVFQELDFPKLDFPKIDSPLAPVKVKGLYQRRVYERMGNAEIDAIIKKRIINSMTDHIEKLVLWEESDSETVGILYVMPKEYGERLRNG